MLEIQQIDEANSSTMLHPLLDHSLPGWVINQTASYQAVPITTGALLMLLFLWRLWRFTLAPALWPQEPKPLPYWIPLIGHSWEFMQHSQGLFSRGQKYFAKGEPYAITIAGQKMVIIRSTRDVAVMWKSTVAFTFDPFVQNVMKAFGLDYTSIENMFNNDPANLVPMDAHSSSMLSADNPSSKCYFHLQKNWLRAQLHPGENLKDIQYKYAAYLMDAVAWNNLSDPYIIRSNEKEKVILLKSFTRQILGTCAMKAFFGKELFDASPSFWSHYQDFEDASWKVFYNYPRLLARNLHKVKDDALDELIRFFALPTEQRPGLVWLFRTMDAELTNLSLGPRDRAGMMMLIIWAMNHNAHKISFWVFAHIINDPRLSEAVRVETAKAYSPDGSIDVEVLLSDCPHLDAVWYEVLRLYNNAAIARKVTVETTIGGKSVHPGETLLGPFRQFHTDRDIFGSDAHRFDPSRFLHDKTLHHTKGYHPFGGGNTYCPGRFFARSEIYIFVAAALNRLDLRMATGETLPDVDLEIPSSSAMPATKDLLVMIRPKNAEV